MSALICIDCRYIRERPSGIHWLVQALVDHLPRLAPDLRFLLLKHPKAPARLSTYPNVQERVVRQEANGPATLLWLPSIVDLRDVSIFHATFNILPAHLNMLTVVTLCDVLWLQHPEWARSPGWWGHVEAAYYTFGIRRALRKATRLIAISSSTKDEIRKVNPSAHARTSVALLGVSEEFRPLGKEGLERISSAKARWLPGADQYILTVGQFIGYKNHERVLRAFALAFRDRPEIHLGFVQRLGAGERILRPLMAELGLSGRVHFVSGLSLSELVALYNGAIALCHPSLYEGFGNPPAEALASGCPVITSNRYSMPEVAGGAALLVDPSNEHSIAAALRQVAFNSGVREAMREQGLARAKQLSWEAFAAANLSVYRELLRLGSAR